MENDIPQQDAVHVSDSGLSVLDAERQLVVFRLAKEDYGVDIGTVREIIRMQNITKVPKTPDFVEGLINLRGKVIPVVDIRKRFDLALLEDNPNNRIVVIDIAGQDIGCIVDAVTEVLRIPANAVEPPSSIITNVESEYLLGIAKLSGRLIILLDLQKVLSHSEHRQLAEMSLVE